MCIIIDINSLHLVLNKSTKDHAKYKPIMDWLNKGKGKIIIGGGKYKNELCKATKYLNLIVEFEKQGCIHYIDDAHVNCEQENVKKKEMSSTFNDPHIVAMSIVSKCKLVCTHDNELKKFIKKRIFYPRNTSIPKLYSHRNHKKQLSRNCSADDR